MEEENKNNNWKVIGIVLIVVLILENGLLFLGYMNVQKQERDIKTCYYDICADYIDAEIQDGICFCYEEDLMGNKIVNKSEIIR